MFWDRSAENSSFNGNRKLPIELQWGKCSVIDFIRASSNLLVKKTAISSQKSSNLGLLCVKLLSDKVSTVFAPLSAQGA